MKDNEHIATPGADRPLGTVRRRDEPDEDIRWSQRRTDPSDAAYDAQYERHIATAGQQGDPDDPEDGILVPGDEQPERFPAEDENQDHPVPREKAPEGTENRGFAVPDRHWPQNIDQGGYCNALVLRDGYGDSCGIPARDESVHYHSVLAQTEPVFRDPGSPAHPPEDRGMILPQAAKIPDFIKGAGNRNGGVGAVAAALGSLGIPEDEARELYRQVTPKPLTPEEETAVLDRINEPHEHENEAVPGLFLPDEVLAHVTSVLGFDPIAMRDERDQAKADVETMTALAKKYLDRARAAETDPHHDIEHQINQLTQWWVEAATADVAKVAPKAAEYGAADFIIMGSALVQMNPAAWAGADDKDRQQVGQEQAIGFYLLGKIGRALSAWSEGRWPSDDTIDDIVIYAMMLRFVRSFGAWDLGRLG